MALVRRILLTDIGLTAAVTAVVFVSINIAEEPHARPVNAIAYVLGLAMALPVLAWRRRPLGALLASSAILFAYYTAGYPGFSPAVALSVQMYFAALAGYGRWAMGIAVFYLVTGFLVTGVKEHGGLLRSFGNLLPHLALLTVIILLGAHVRSRRELAAETRERLRQAEESREREAARRVAEERLRIARELHDTIAHSLATITVQAGSALHLLGDSDDGSRAALVAIRATGKETLAEIRATLGVLRESDAADAALPSEHGLDRLPALLDAVRAAGLPVETEIAGAGLDRALDREVDHAAYRILQEALTNVLRHAGAEATACVRLTYRADELVLDVTDDGTGVREDTARATRTGHGLPGMRERAEMTGGTLTAGPRPGGGFAVTARLPYARPDGSHPRAERESRP